MVQMGSASEACAVVENLNGVTLFGYTLSLRQCSYDVIHEIPEPLPLPDGSPSYRLLHEPLLFHFSNGSFLCGKGGKV